MASDWDGWDDQVGRDWHDPDADGSTDPGAAVDLPTPAGARPSQVRAIADLTGDDPVQVTTVAHTYRGPIVAVTDTDVQLGDVPAADGRDGVQPGPVWLALADIRRIVW